MNEEELMKDPEYKAYLDAHPMEWIDNFIRNRLMKGEEVSMPSEGIWLWSRIADRFKEKGYEWLKEDLNLDKSDYHAALEWESIPPKKDLITGKEYRGEFCWIFRMKVERNKDMFD